jgi:hypothetical protein
MLSVLFVVLAASLAAPHASLSREALLNSPTRHVRTMNADVQRLLASGIDRSPTFHAMMARLEGTDVIVYIEPVPMLPGTLVGRLVMLPYGGSQRYLRIQVTFGQSSADTIALIGHELRHALEIAEARNVVDEKDLIALYRRIGDRAREGLHQYDTAAARSTGQRVSRELA